MAIAAAAAVARPSLRALRRPSTPSVVPSPPRTIGPLRKKTNTPKSARTLHTNPTVAGRFRPAGSRHAQRPISANSPIVKRITRGTRITPSRSCGTTNQRRLHHDPPRSRIPWIRGKKIAARAVTTAPAQRRAVFVGSPPGGGTDGDATPLHSAEPASARMERLRSSAVATGGNEWEMRRQRKPEIKPKPLPWVVTVDGHGCFVAQSRGPIARDQCRTNTTASPSGALLDRRRPGERSVLGPKRPLASAR